MEKKQILVADDEANLRRVLTAQLERDGYDVISVEDGAAAMEAVAQHHLDLIITDLRMPKADGMAVLKHVMESAPRIPVIMITAHGTVDTAVEALKLGAYDFVTKPFEKAEFRHVVRKAVRTKELADRDVGGAGRFDIVGQSKAMQAVYDIIGKVAATPSTALITGESGTGKELIARALHENSPRREKPFIGVNCAAIPRELIESELFGYEKGAFTGAVTSKPGRFELAHGGTLFLDEIAEVPIDMQVKLLRALQEQSFERVGGIKTLQVDVRLVAATNRDLLADIAAGMFREDLYYRLNVVPIALPALRDRMEDIPLLADHFLRRLNPKLGKDIQGISGEAMARLRRHHWRGNVRELENAIERSVLFADGDLIEAHDLPEALKDGGRAPSTLAPTPLTSPGNAVSGDHESQPPEKLAFGDAGLKERVRDVTVQVERELIVKALGQTGGNVTHTARLLKISRKSLQTKMKELGLRES